jgi:POT family proton-dependent oligopeptide transporter
VRAVLRVLVAFALVTPFWSLFDQKASTWVLAANDMTKPSWFQPAQMQALNPALVMALIPFNNIVLFPFLRRLGYEPTALRRMTAGIALSSVAWIAIGVIQLVIDGGTPTSITWQMPALPVPHPRRGAGLGHRRGVRLQPGAAVDEGRHHELLVPRGDHGQPVGALANAGLRNEAVISRIAQTGISTTAFLMFAFAAFAALAAFAFGLYARRYKTADFYRNA